MGGRGRPEVFIKIHKPVLHVNMIIKDITRAVLDGVDSVFMLMKNLFRKEDSLTSCQKKRGVTRVDFREVINGVFFEE